MVYSSLLCHHRRWIVWRSWLAFCYSSKERLKSNSLLHETHLSHSCYLTDGQLGSHLFTVHSESQRVVMLFIFLTISLLIPPLPCSLIIMPFIHSDTARDTTWRFGCYERVQRGWEGVKVRNLSWTTDLRTAAASFCLTTWPHTPPDNGTAVVAVVFVLA